LRGKEAIKGKQNMCNLQMYVEKERRNGRTQMSGGRHTIVFLRRTLHVNGCLIYVEDKVAIATD